MTIKKMVVNTYPQKVVEILVKFWLPMTTWFGSLSYIKAKGTNTAAGMNYAHKLAI